MIYGVQLAVSASLKVGPTPAVVSSSSVVFLMPLALLSCRYRVFSRRFYGDFIWRASSWPAFLLRCFLFFFLFYRGLASFFVFFFAAALNGGFMRRVSYSLFALGLLGSHEGNSLKIRLCLFMVKIKRQKAIKDVESIERMWSATFSVT